ncbi:hypothetical protein BV20DRAFT_980526 [Pilatotrama ljubarskyi]|nr:hypothetical protein BV20DRAFT_980526 [Pilatotrama ljubarskyi]
MPLSRRSSQPPGSSNNTNNNIFRRFTNKLRVSSAPDPAPPTISGPKSQDAQPHRRRTGLRMPSLPKAPPPAAPPNDFTSLEQRQAALRARGLLPPASGSYRDANGFMVPLSEQEAELDRRFAVVVEDRHEEEAESEARKIREAWLARNKDILGEGGSKLTELDAVSRASRDGTLGDKSPMHATYVDAPPLSPGSAAEVASPLDATVEDFHTAPNTPANPTSDSTTTTLIRTPRDPPGSPSSNSSAVTEKVSRWLRSSTDAPTPLSVSTDPSTVQPLSESPRASLANEPGAQTPQAVSPAGTVKAAKPRKEKPPPIVVTAQRPSKDSDVKAPAQIVSVAIAAAALSDSDASTSDGRSFDARGRHQSLSATPSNAPQQPHPPLLAHANSNTSASTSGTSRSTTLPALSPTRTISSSGAESTLPTPTTTSCQRDVSISRGSVSHSSDQSHGITGRPRRGTGSGSVEDALQAKVSANPHRRMSGAGAGVGGIMQSSIEETDSSEEGEFGAPAETAPIAPMVRARPPRIQTAEQAAEAQANRRSFSLFGKKSSDLLTATPLQSTQAARPSSSMSNLRRAFSGGLASKLHPRPRSSIDPSTSTPEMAMGRKRSKMFDASHLPSSPTQPPTSFPGVAVPVQARAPGVGPRPRQPVSPTMHNRGSILHQTHFIEDDESRRLSEMAFLT